MSLKGRNNGATNLKIFLSSTTIHGLNKLGSEETKSGAKLGWSLLFIFSFSFAVYTLQDMVQTWAENPIDTNINIAPIGEIPFPSVTLCPKGMTRHGLSEFVFNLVEVTDEVRRIVAPIMARLLRFSPILVTQKGHDTRTRSEDFLCSGISDYCNAYNDESIREKAVKRYFESCANDEKRTFCRLLNLKYLEIWQHFKKTSAFRAFFNHDNATVNEALQWKGQFSFPVCHEEAIERKWLNDEAAPIPDWDEIVAVCTEHLPLIYKSQVDEGTILDVAEFTSGKYIKRDLLAWEDFIKDVYFKEINRRIYVRPPKMENLGSFVQLLRTQWIFDPNYIYTEAGVKELPIRSGLDLSSTFDKFERDILGELFGVDEQLFTDFEDFALAFSSLPGLQVSSKHFSLLNGVFPYASLF